MTRYVFSTKEKLPQNCVSSFTDTYTSNPKVQQGHSQRDDTVVLQSRELDW